MLMKDSGASLVKFNWEKPDSVPDCTVWWLLLKKSSDKLVVCVFPFFLSLASSRPLFPAPAIVNNLGRIISCLLLVRASLQGGERWDFGDVVSLGCRRWEFRCCWVLIQIQEGKWRLQ